MYVSKPRSSLGRLGGGSRLSSVEPQPRAVKGGDTVAHGIVDVTAELVFLSVTATQQHNTILLLFYQDYYLQSTAHSNKLKDCVVGGIATYGYWIPMDTNGYWGTCFPQVLTFYFFLYFHSLLTL